MVGIMKLPDIFLYSLCSASGNEQTPSPNTVVTHAIEGSVNLNYNETKKSTVFLQMMIKDPN